MQTRAVAGQGSPRAPLLGTQQQKQQHLSPQGLLPVRRAVPERTESTVTINDRKYIKRTHIINEILDTEKTYVSSLRIIVQVN